MNSSRRQSKTKKRGRVNQRATWFVLRDGDGDLCAVSKDRRALEDTKEILEKTRPCGTYTIQKRKVEDPTSEENTTRNH